MPVFDEATVKGLLLRNALQAISVDTNIFDRYHNAFHLKPLSLLGQFDAKGIQFIVSKVVVEEVTGHVRSNTAKAQEALQQALTKYRRILDLPPTPEVDQALRLTDDIPTFAMESVEAFLNSTGAEIVPFDDDGLSDEVMRRYFAQEPPFSDRALKKQEFPDAFALLSLEQWARTNDSHVLLVSLDNDWVSYCETSEQLFCTGKLPEAIALFKEQDDLVVTAAIASYRQGTSPQLQGRIKAAIIEYFNDFDTDHFGEYPFQYELDTFDVEATSIELPDNEPVSVLDSDETSISFSARFKATIEITANFSVSVWDGTDKEYVNLGGDSHSRKATGNFEMVIEIERGIHVEPVVNSVFVNRSDIRIPFDNLEPNWRGDE